MPLDTEYPVDGPDETPEVLNDDPAPDGDEPSVEAAEDTGPKGAVLSADELLADLKQRVEKGEISGDKLLFTQPKVQSTFGGKFSANRKAVNDGITPILEAKGVSLPDGKTPWDLMNEEGGKTWFEVQRKLIDEANAPIRAKMSQEESERIGTEKIRETITAFPEFKDDLQDIVKVILADPLMSKFADVPEAIPLLIAGVGRDRQVLKLLPENAALKQQNAELVARLKKAGIAVKTGTETTKAKPTTPGKTTGGKARSLLQIAEEKYDRAMGTSR